GIAAANTNNGQGIAGICPQCRILPLKVLDSVGSGNLSDVAAAIRYSVDQGADVINLSLGGEDCTADLADAINYAYERNVTIVASSGNSCPVKVALGLETFEVSYPAQFGRVIAVGATNSSDNRAYFSHYGATLDITAPGVDILSTYLNGGYKYLDGTSMASPMVAGLAGLLLSQDQSLTSAQVQTIIETSSDDIDSPGWDENTGWGRINAGRALQTTIGDVDSVPPVVCTIKRDEQAKAFPSKEEDILSVYTQLRDEVLLSTTLGRSYVNMFYEYGPELAGILLTDTGIRDKTAQFLDSASEEFGSLLPSSTSEITLTQELYNEADDLVQDLAAAGSDDFRDKLLQVWDDLLLEQRIGEETKEIWEQMNNFVYLPMILK
ncbi:MAG: S8 family serine peptidase, partial [Anaerolineales bacterium]|nr:S8 family serine peptidase [Anaerolineales bacterium]